MTNPGKGKVWKLLKDIALVHLLVIAAYVGLAILTLPINFAFIFYSRDPYPLELALRQYDKTEAEVVQALGKPKESFTRQQVERGEVPWPWDGKFRPLPNKAQGGHCLVYEMGLSYILVYFDPKGISYRIHLHRSL